MKIGIISDSHDQIERIRQVVEIFNRENVDLMIHCGDMVAPFTLQFYQELKCPKKFLFGNNTGDIAFHFSRAEKYGLQDYEFGIFFSLDADGRKIAVYHGEVPEITEALIKSGEYDCVFAGHTHTPKVEKRGKVLFVNPGTLLEKYAKDKGSCTVAIYDSETHSARLVPVTD